MKKWMYTVIAVISISGLALADGTARTVKYHSKDIIAIKGKLRYTTLIALPSEEKIVEAASGDKDFWIIDAVQNFCFLHPAKAGIHSNLNLITDKGNVYSFTLDEVSGDPDLKVVIEPADASALAALGGAPKLVSSAEVDAYRAQVQMAQMRAQDAIVQFKSEYPTKHVKFDYRFRSEAPFNISAIYHDDQFTYIKSDASEKFSLYELKDNKPNLVNFELRDGTYIVAKVIDKGYLEIGKKHLSFERKQ